jgi:hypothetical protein
MHKARGADNAAMITATFSKTGLLRHGYRVQNLWKNAFPRGFQQPVFHIIRKIRVKSSILPWESMWKLWKSIVESTFRVDRVHNTNSVTHGRRRTTILRRGKRASRC